ncbi:MAG: RloA protein [Deltaproteobacteria bacterium RIFOXYD12_FULL_57_12]|nr:MAG: RloA protein [Deltaproteobacteria bacterium RIFOXYD12_FULL_57_12]
MLIEFSVANFRSFWEPRKLSLTATPQKDLLESNTFESPVSGLPRLLRSAVVYGPNAGGKSNFIRAMWFVKQFVVSSAKEHQEGEGIAVNPFLFNQLGASHPSEFEVQFIQEGVRYQYGFAATKERVTNEWLIAYPGGRAQRWFERTFQPESNDYQWYFGSRFIGRKKQWQEMTRNNALFLSTAIQWNSEQLKPVFTWFQRLYIIGHGTLIDPGFSIKLCQNDEKKKRILAFMNEADISISDILMETKEFSVEDLPSDMPEALKDDIRQKMDGKKMMRVGFLHPVKGEESPVILPLEEESDGTRKLFAYAGPWLDILTQGRILFADELDTSLHPKIMRFLLSMFHNNKTNQANGQLIFTTHDTSLLDQDLVRRDQVWFVDKDQANASQLYPLTDFKPRAGEALQKGYLNGRYGALPYTSEARP